MEDSPSSHPRLAADPLLRRGDRGLGSERGQEAASRYLAPGRAVPGRLPQGRSEPWGSTVTARGWEAGSLSPHPRSAAIQTPPGLVLPAPRQAGSCRRTGRSFPKRPASRSGRSSCALCEQEGSAEGPGAEGPVGAPAPQCGFKFPSASGCATARGAGAAGASENKSSL